MDTGAYEEPVPQRGLRDRLADAAAGQFGVVRRLLWSTFLAAVVGVLCGVVVYVFLWLLRQVTITRLDHPWLLWLLPILGLLREVQRFLHAAGSPVRGPGALWSRMCSYIAFHCYAPLIAVAAWVVRPEWKGRSL